MCISNHTHIRGFAHVCVGSHVSVHTFVLDYMNVCARVYIRPHVSIARARVCVESQVSECTRVRWSVRISAKNDNQR